mmetsp:Transcript_22231/g.54785  ORF Transcript_22231/g.54785 Transcript_22231/m.54785 type:complete len:231 (+) Transcript_22231:106-798(+)
MLRTPTRKPSKTSVECGFKRVLRPKNHASKPRHTHALPTKEKIRTPFRGVHCSLPPVHNHIRSPSALADSEPATKPWLRPNWFSDSRPQLSACSGCRSSTKARACPSHPRHHARCRCPSTPATAPSARSHQRWTPRADSRSPATSHPPPAAHPRPRPNPRSHPRLRPQARPQAPGPPPRRRAGPAGRPNPSYPQRTRASSWAPLPPFLPPQARGARPPPARRRARRPPSP